MLDSRPTVMYDLTCFARSTTGAGIRYAQRQGPYHEATCVKGGIETVGSVRWMRE